MGGIRVFLADDNLIVREGVRALLEAESDLEVVGTAGDYDGLIAGASESDPQVVVTDIRMPPTFSREGVDAALALRKWIPGLGVVLLSQYSEPEYAIDLVREQGAEGFAYLLKDRVAEAGELGRAVREVAAGRSRLDPKLVETMLSPVRDAEHLDHADEVVLGLIAEGRPVKAIAAALRTTPADGAARVERAFGSLGRAAGGGAQSALRHLRLLHEAIVEREELGRALSSMLPPGVADQVLRSGSRVGESETIEATVVISDVRGYCTIAEDADLATLARQLSTYRAAMTRAASDAGGTVMHYGGDAVMAVFGAPIPIRGHARAGLAAARAMHAAQSVVNRDWAASELPPFYVGIGVTSGEMATALLGSEDRLEYTVVGDTVNLAQRLQQLAAGGEIVMSRPAFEAAGRPPAERLPRVALKGRRAPVTAYRLAPA